MTADEDDSLLRYLNRVSLQVITLLDLDGRLDSVGGQQPLAKAPDIKRSMGRAEAIESGKTTRGAKQRLSQAMGKQDAKGGDRQQPLTTTTTRKMTRARRSQQQQQQRQSKRNKSQQQQQQQQQQNGELKEQLFEQSFKTLDDDEKTIETNEQQLQLSNCLHDHEHYMGAPNHHHNHHHHHAQATGGTVDSLIQLDGGGHLSSVNLLTLTMGDELGHQLDSHQTAHNGDVSGDLLASPTTTHLSPIDPTIAQLGAGLGATSYYATSSAYDDFVGHDTSQNAPAGPASTATSLNDHSASSPTSIAAQTYHHQHPATDTIGQTLTDCYSHHSHNHHHHHHHHHQQQHNHHQQAHQHLQSATVHHHYQPQLSQQQQHNHFDHRAPGHGEQHQQQQQQQHQQWLSPLIVHCGSSPTQQPAPGQHHHQQLQQPIDQHDINYHGAPPAYQQQEQAGYHHYPGTLTESHSFQQQQQQQHSHLTANGDEFVSLSSASTRTTTTTTTASNNADTNPAGNSRASFELAQQTDRPSDETNNGSSSSNNNNNNNGTTNSHEIHTPISSSATTTMQYDPAGNHHSHLVDHHHTASGHALSHNHHQHHHHQDHLQQHHQPQHLNNQLHNHNHMMHHHHLHPGHLMPPLNPFVNGIEPSSVILHDINLASASWSSPEDLYSI